MKSNVKSQEHGAYILSEHISSDVAAKICEELFTPMPPHAELALNGVEVFLNASGSHHHSDVTRSHEKLLAEEIGSWHLAVSIDSVISSLLSLFQTLTGKRPVYKVDGGSNAENLELQNIQARIRMVLAYMLASLLPWAHGKPGFYLVLGCSNVDKALHGYLTKYDYSSAYINPIGSIIKQDLRTFLKWAAVDLGYSSLDEIEATPPTGELEPIRSN